MRIRIIQNIHIIVTLKSLFKENKVEIRKILTHPRNLREIVRTVFELISVIPCYLLEECY